jgi:hypothetical protein
VSVVSLEVTNLVHVCSAQGLRVERPGLAIF